MKVNHHFAFFFFFHSSWSSVFHGKFDLYALKVKSTKRGLFLFVFLNKQSPQVYWRDPWEKEKGVADRAMTTLQWQA